MRTLDAKLLSQFLKKAGSELKGEWLLVGGTVLPAVGLNVRSTVDIDLIGLGKMEQAQALELMTITESLNLPVETINQAAIFFLRKVRHTKKDLLLLHKGKNAVIYRPSVELYWKLKVGRLSESDAIDCQHYFNYCRGQQDQVSISNLKKILDEAKKKPHTPEKLARLKDLEGACAASFND